MNGDSAASLRELAGHCRRLAVGASTAEVATSLNEMAGGFERRAAVAAEAEAKAAAEPEPGPEPR